MNNLRNKIKMAGFFFLAALCHMRDLSSLTRDQTCARRNGIAES